MNVKTFHAVNMREALAKIKAEMGPQAVIINSRQIKKGNAAFGFFARPFIEVTAASDEEARRKKGKVEVRNDTWNNGRRPKNLKRKEAANGKMDSLEPMLSALDPLRTEIAQLKELISANADANILGRTELKKAARFSDDLETMTSMFNFMIEQSDFHKGLNLDTNFLICYQRMIERGVEPRFAMSLVKKVKENVPGGREIDLRTIINEVVDNIQESMFIADPISPYAAGPRIVSLIGPTGVGKTTTIAKIAAELSLEGKKVGLITIDTYRIAAVEQLKIYAGILNIPVEVVITPDELSTAITNYCTKDVIFIDTAGRSQRDSEKLDELTSFLESNETIENYLVLSAVSESAALDETVKNFGCVPLAGLIFTKLDETTRPGVVISQNFKTGLPVVYTTHGQKVPEDMEKASAKKLAIRLFKKEI